MPKMQSVKFLSVCITVKETKTARRILTKRDTIIFHTPESAVYSIIFITLQLIGAEH